MQSNRVLEKGDKAPDFSLESDTGEKVSLAHLKGKKVVFYFYPKDSTPGCTTEAKEFSEALARFKRKGAVILGVSKDSVKSHCNFRDKQGLTITLLSDPELTAHHAYGAFGEKLMYGKKVQGTIRSTFLIDENGVLAEVWRGVKVKGHVDAVFEAVSARE